MNPGILPTLCKKKRGKEAQHFWKKKIFNKNEEKKEHTVFARRKLKPTGTIVL